MNPNSNYNHSSSRAPFCFCFTTPNAYTVPGRCMFSSAHESSRRLRGAARQCTGARRGPLAPAAKFYTDVRFLRGAMFPRFRDLFIAGAFDVRCLRDMERQKPSECHRTAWTVLTFVKTERRNVLILNSNYGCGCITIPKVTRSEGEKERRLMAHARIHADLVP